MLEWLAKTWCALMHVGGDVCRDPQGRINWRCRQCRRWSDEPVTPETEKFVLDREIEKFSKRIESKEGE